MDYQLTVSAVTDANRKAKYISAMGALAKSMKVPLKVRRKDEKGEVFPFRISRDLVEEWTKWYESILGQVYVSACRALDLPIKDRLSKAGPDDALVYKGKILYTPETGKPITVGQWDAFIKAIEKFLNRNLAEAERKVVLNAAALGKILNRMLKYNTWEAVEKLRLNEARGAPGSGPAIDDIRAFRKHFRVPESEMDRISVAQESAGIYIQGIGEKTRDSIRHVIVQGIKDKSSKGDVSQALFDSFGSINRDWQRIVETETNEAMNTAYLLAEVHGAGVGPVYFQRHEAFDDAVCPHCERIKGMVVKWSGAPMRGEKIEDRYAKIAIWEGKSRFGRKAKDTWVAAGTQHPWCYSSDTEVLTDSGWKKFPDLASTDLIMSINPETKEVGFVPFVRSVSYQYDGEMIHFHARNFDLLVTPDHNMLYSTRKLHGELREASASELIGKFAFMLPRAVGEWNGNVEIATPGGMSLETYVKLWAWFLSEGSIRTNKISRKLLDGRTISYDIKIAQKDPETIIKSLVEIRDRLNKGFDAVYLSDQEIGKDLAVFEGVRSYEKYIPSKIKNLPPALLGVFLDTYVEGDGTNYNGEYRHASSYSVRSERVIYTSSRKMADDLCEIIVKAGFIPSVRITYTKGMDKQHRNGVYTTKTDIYTISILTSKFKYFFKDNRAGGMGGDLKRAHKESYSGMVYDVELEKWHHLLVKRNGKVSWSGNCRGVWSRWHPPGKTPAAFDAMQAKLRGRAAAWGSAVEAAKKEFAERGIQSPTDETPGYLDRINAIYTEGAPA